MRHRAAPALEGAAEKWMPVFPKPRAFSTNPESLLRFDGKL
jgi:hypothetical protein